MSILELRGLGKAYGSGRDAHRALSDVTLTVQEAEFLSIVGPSGCGKTTLMKCVAGLIRPSSGEVRVMGQVVNGVPDGLAIVFQDYSRSLFPWMKVGRNV